MKFNLMAALLGGAVLGGGAVFVAPKIIATAHANDDTDTETVEYSFKSGSASIAQRARFAAADHVAPLVVDLHQWGGTEKGANGDKPFDIAVREKGWNFIRPSLAGPNNTPRACCSDEILSGINAAIQYAKTHGKVDPKSIYIVGASGGGYTALCAYMTGKVQAKAYIAWVPITDLVAWKKQHPNDKYGQDISACTSSTGGKLNIAECAKRSPITMGQGQPDKPVYVFAGIHDGTSASTVTSGSVLFTHSINFFNRLADLQHRPDEKVANATVMQMMDDRTGPDTDAGRTVNGRQIHLSRSFDKVHLTIFEGEHEMLTDATVDLIARQPS